MTLDLRTPSGRELFLQLVEKSDLLLENNSVGFLEKFSIGVDQVTARNPSISIVRMPALGASGPYVEYMGFGANFEALCGLTSLRGYPDLDPTYRNPTAYMDAATGSMAAFACLVAILRNRRTGTGSVIELAQTETTMQTIGEYLISAANGGLALGTIGNRDLRYAPQGAYPCTGDDQWVAIAVRSDEEWAALCHLMGDPDWSADPKLANVPGRWEQHDDVDARISEWTSTLDRYDVFRRCQEMGVPAAPLLTEADAFDDPQLAARSYFLPLTAPDTGTHLYPGHSFRWSGPPLAWDKPAPALGEDNEYVYKTVLGLNDEEYAEAEAQGHISRDYLDHDGNPL
jgi:crotonobetainyl-CoA:carnitine CoA-transferase CaiB-like acyl-CoA transferase